jgi:AbrB family looped-hinge helix DNA binding protein
MLQKMSGLATITSKRQLTIPVKLFDELGLSTGDKMIVDSNGGELRLRKATKMVSELAGSVRVNKNLRNVDQAIAQAKRARFGK